MWECSSPPEEHLVLPIVLEEHDRPVLPNLVWFPIHLVLPSLPRLALSATHHLASISVHDHLGQPALLPMLGFASHHQVSNLRLPLLPMLELSAILLLHCHHVLLREQHHPPLPSWVFASHQACLLPLLPILGLAASHLLSHHLQEPLPLLPMQGSANRHWEHP